MYNSSWERGSNAGGSGNNDQGGFWKKIYFWLPKNLD
jgi:hypothetical protein